MLLKQAHEFRTAHLIPHLGRGHPFAAFRHQRIRIERVWIGYQFVVVRVLARVRTVRLTAFSGLAHADLRQHIGIIGCSNLPKAVLVGAVPASEHPKLCICCKRDARHQHRPEHILQRIHNLISLINLIFCKDTHYSHTFQTIRQKIAIDRSRHRDRMV